MLTVLLVLLLLLLLLLNISTVETWNDRYVQTKAVLKCLPKFQYNLCFLIYYYRLFFSFRDIKFWYNSSVRPSVPYLALYNAYNQHTYHSVPQNNPYHCFRILFTATCDLHLPHIVLTGRTKHGNAKACVRDSHSTVYFCHMTKCIYVRLRNETAYKQPNFWDFSFMRLFPHFVLKMTVSVMFLPRAAVAVSVIMNQRTPDVIRGGPTLWQYIVQSRDWPTARFKILNAIFQQLPWQRA